MIVFYLSLAFFVAIVTLALFWPMRQKRFKMLAASLGVFLSTGVLYSHWGASQQYQTALHYDAIYQVLVRLQNDVDLSGDTVRLALTELERTLPSEGLLWARMGDIYQHLAWYSDASRAYQRALKKNPDHVPYKLNYLYAQTLQSQGVLTPENLKLLSEVLYEDPRNSAALNLLAMDAFRKKDFSLAIDLWETQLRELPMDSPERDKIAQAIDVAKARGGISSSAEVLRVAVAPEVALKDLDPKTPVFVYVKSPAGGPPIWVKRVSLAALNDDIIIKSADQMLQGREIQEGEPVIVGVRVSLNGAPKRQSGDWEGETAEIKLVYKMNIRLQVAKLDGPIH